MAHLKKSALALPEAEQGTHFGMVAFTVRGKNFVSVTSDGVLQLRLADEQADIALARFPSAERLVRMGTPIGVLIPLADVDGKELNALLREAWGARAPKRLVAARARAEAGVAADSDLPTSIGKPATQGLLAAGISTRVQAAQLSDEELLALHGVGPKAVRLLREANESR